MAPVDIRGVDVSMLRTFDALMREGSVSRAASRLFLGQPVVSASLKRLRTSFNDPLFTRTAHGIVPTARALQLAPRVQAVLHELQLLVNDDQVFDPTQSDRIIRLSGSDHSSRELLPRLCQRLESLGSRMRLFWDLPDYDRLADRLRKGDIDLGFLPRSTPVAGIESLLLFEDSYVTVTRRIEGRPLPGIDLEDFCARPQIVLGQSRSALDDTIDQLLARQGKKRWVQAAATTFSQMVDVLAGSDLIAIFPQRVAARYAAQLDIVPLPFALPNYRLYLGWDARSNTDQAVMWIKGEIQRLGFRH